MPLALLACACGSKPAPNSPGAGGAKQEIAALLDELQAAAARADESDYFAKMAPEAIFIGTDPGERWDIEAFRQYASPRFAKGKSWTMKATKGSAKALLPPVFAGTLLAPGQPLDARKPFITLPDATAPARSRNPRHGRLAAFPAKK